MGIKRDADTGADGNLAVAELETVVDPRQQSPGEAGCLGFVLEHRGDDGKFVPAETGDNAFLAESFGQTVGKASQQIVAKGMTIDVVDRFEPVEVEHHYGTKAVGLHFTGQIGKGLQQPAAIWQPGQRVVLGKGQGFGMSRGSCLQLLAQTARCPRAISQTEDGDAQKEAGDHVERHLRIMDLVGREKYWKDLNPSKNDKNYRK